MPVLKVETDIIISNSITASPTGRSGILVMMHVETLKTGTTVFISIKRLDVTHTDVFQYKSKSFDTNIITQLISWSK
jgi:hypothetical protein